MWILLVVIIIGWMLLYVFEKQQIQQRELGRFRDSEGAGELSIQKKVDRWFESLGRRYGHSNELRKDSKNSEKEMARKLRDAGLETTGAKGRYAAIRFGCYLSWPGIAAAAWMNFTPYYATVFTLFSFALVIIMPHLWLSRKTIGRLEDIQRELPLVIDLTNLATSAGWDLAAALERVIDALAPEFPNHPLIKELKKARILASSGYTWGEALDRVSRKLGDDTVTRVTLALVQAMDQGGDRSAQLAGIALDAQRTYYSALDKRLASIPVKALVITMVLFLTYFAVLLAPAMVGIAVGGESL
jgi:Flp pilus assembly protein TadB